MKPQKRAWMVRPFPHRINRIVEFLRDDIVALGWPLIGNLQSKGLEEIKARVRPVYKPASTHSLGQIAGELDKLVNRMAHGDYVIVPSPESDAIYVGEIRGGYRFDPTADNKRDGFCHQRPVRWLMDGRAIPRAYLPAQLDNPLKYRQAVCSADVNAVEKILSARDSNQPDDENDDYLTGVEGKRRQVLRTHIARERKLRETKIRQALASGDQRLRCEVPGCGFDFEAVYGTIGHGFAHVHHCKPLASLRKATIIRLNDLAIVCANCHAMIHAGGQCRSINGLIKRPFRPQQQSE